MNCLSCKNEMINHHVITKKQEIAYDLCESCGSLWLDAGELDKLAFKVDGSIEYSSNREAKTKEEIHDCPRCDGKKLAKVYFIGYSDIVLDHCKHCGGFFLDGGEYNLVNRELEQIMPIKGQGFADFVNNVHVPFWHKRFQKRSSKTDFAVEVQPVKNSKMLKATDLSCPACSEKMNLYSVFRIEYEGCPKCKGLWLDLGELRKLKDKQKKHSWLTLSWMDDEVNAIEESSATVSDRNCPKCSGKKLVSANLGSSNVVIDWCAGCRGRWLDQDEFGAIVKFLSNKLNKLSADEMKGKVYQEIKEIWNGPEGAISEIADAKAAIEAMINIWIFDHPKLAKAMIDISQSSPIK